jgi:GxxExxY protein
MTSGALLEQETTNHIIGAFFDVYNILGFGFLEHVYAEALERELVERVSMVQKEVVVPVWHKGTILSTQRVDMIVDDRVVVEIKSTDVLAPTAQRQLLNYLRATSFPVGLLLRFGPRPRFSRLVHSHKTSSALNR